MSTRSSRSAAVICVGLTCSYAAFAGAADDLRLRSLAATCGACHGTDGEAIRGLANPPLAGLPREYFLRQMRAFRDGTRTASVMQQIAKGYSEAQIAALSGYFAERPTRQ